MRTATTIQSVILSAALTLSACSGSSPGGSGPGNGGASQGGDMGTGGAVSNAGSAATGGTKGAGGAATGGLAQVGGATSVGGAATGGAATGGNLGLGGTVATGGMNAAGGARTGGSPSIGGGLSTGGISPTGGANPQGGSSTVGGSKATGGNVAATGGATNAGGTKATGGATAAGGAATGGTTGTTTGCVVQLGSTHQTIQGFGINDTWAPTMTSAQATALFSATSGIGLTILRVGLGPDGNPMSSNIPGDITTAKAAGATKIIGSCWSPPANCKTNNSVNDGGHVISNDGGTCYNSWSTTIANFAKSNGLYAMSIANEPDFASCGSADPCNGNYPTTLFTANEMVAFLKVAGPKLKAQGVKVIAPEASEWVHQWSNVSAGPDAAGKNSSDPLKCGCFGMTAASATNCAASCSNGGGYDYGHVMAADATAWAAIDILGVHEYDSQRAEPWPADINGGKPNKELWQTEMSGVKWWPEQGPSSDINNGVAVAGWIHSALVDGQVSAWLWWWYQANNTDDNEGLLLKSGTDTKRHYTFGNYSKFVRPGYVMVDVTGNTNANVLLSAFKGTDGTVAIVAINKGTSAATIPISIAGGTAPASCTPTVTSSADNLAAKTAVTVTGGSFTASLAATTVTTFVCK